MDRDDQVSKAIKALSDTITPARLSRSDISACQRQVDELQTGLAKLRKENEKSAYKFYLTTQFLYLGRTRSSQDSTRDVGLSKTHNISS